MDLLGLILTVIKYAYAWIISPWSVNESWVMKHCHWHHLCYEHATCDDWTLMFMWKLYTVSLNVYSRNCLGTLCDIPKSLQGQTSWTSRIWPHWPWPVNWDVHTSSRTCSTWAVLWVETSFCPLFYSDHAQPGWSYLRQPGELTLPASLSAGCWPLS